MTIQASDILGGMPPVSLSEMDSVRLMNRMDNKFLTDERTLRRVLEKASSLGYLVFESDGARILDYRSLYYDTPSLEMYLDHHNRRLVRQKLRTRCYVASGVTFLELKSKNNHGRTKKKRMEIAPAMYCQQALSDASQRQWLSGIMTYPVDLMSPSLETTFSRITLVNPLFTERTTIDTGLVFKNLRSGESANMGPLAVIEVKQDGYMRSEMREILLEERIKPVRISKYCIGISLTSPHIKSGRFKRKIMLINKMKEQYD